VRPPSNCLTVLEAVMGSRAYGLATPTSDTDKLGIFVRPTSDFWLLKKQEETYTGADDVGDYTYHEAGKFVRLALKCNPTLIELLWRTEYTVTTNLGDSLILKSPDFLSQEYVRNSYLGYMTQQFQRILRRQEDPGLFSNVKKNAKNARHLWRLANQGTSLWQWGVMDVELEPYEAQECTDFGEIVAAGNTELLHERISWAEKIFNEKSTSLPQYPNEASIETWLVNIRQRMLVPQRGLDLD
jgi:uncharacterized protein